MFGQQNLTEMHTSLKNGEQNIKFNIHLKLNNELKNWSIAANQQLIKGIDHDIEFGDNSIMIPHITLVIGELKNANDLNTVVNIASQVLARAGSINVEFSHMDFSKNNQWAFLWTKENSKINQLAESLEQSLAPYFTVTSKNPPHITLAKAKELQKNKHVLDQLEFPKGYVATSADFAFCGKAGTVLEVIKSTALNARVKK